MKWALVTGGAQRLGRAAALELSRAGWGVVIQYRASGEAARATCDALDHLNEVEVNRLQDLHKELVA